MHSWKSHTDRKTQKRFTAGIQSQRRSSKIFWNNDFWEVSISQRSSSHPPMSHTGCSDCTPQLRLCTFISTGENCFALCQLSCFICAHQTTPQHHTWTEALQNDTLSSSDSEAYMQQRASLPTFNYSDQHCTQTYTGRTLGITSTNVINVIKKPLSHHQPKVQ